MKYRSSHASFMRWVISIFNMKSRWNMNLYANSALPPFHAVSPFPVCDAYDVISSAALVADQRIPESVRFMIYFHPPALWACSGLLWFPSVEVITECFGYFFPRWSIGQYTHFPFMQTPRSGQLIQSPGEWSRSTFARVFTYSNSLRSRSRLTPPLSTSLYPSPAFFPCLSLSGQCHASGRSAQLARIMAQSFSHRLR